MTSLVPRCGFPTTTALLCVLVIGGGTVQPALAADRALNQPPGGFVYPNALMTLEGTEAPSVLPEQQRTTDDLVKVADAQYASLDGLAAGSREAQDQQRRAVSELGLPLEVKTAKTGILLRLIPAGSFTMGSPRTEQDACVKAGAKRESVNDEIQHQTTLTKPFYCGKYEVTQGQWEAVMGSNPSNFKHAGSEAPVEGISWKACQTFVKKLCEIEGVPEGTYRLLTEAEWEYACRAGTATPFCYGNDLNESMANFDVAGRKGEYRLFPVRVGSFRPNAWGLFDMHGNVGELCQDWHGEYASGSVTDPLGPTSGDSRVRRGGDWYFSAGDCRSASRGRSSPGGRAGNVGLRLARTIQSTPLPLGSTAEQAREAIQDQTHPLSDKQRIPDDLLAITDAPYALLEGLAPGSREAQQRQREAIRRLGLPLEVKTVKTGVVFRLVPAGGFRMGTMGSSFNESIYTDDEGPHRVTLAQAFYCGKYEVTQGQWESVWVGSNPSYFKNAGRDAPVDGVSWGDCQRFVKKLCQMEEVPEGTYRLLTEAEWEYACRAGTEAALYSGDLATKGAFNGPALDPIAWYGGNSGVQYAGGHDSSGWSEKQYNHKSAGTHPVGQKLANAYGLYDMIGNVEEWCQDRYGAYPTGPVTDPLGPPSGVDRVCRGGKWSSVPDFCRSAERERWKPSHYYNGLGLRLARTAQSYSGGFLAE